MAQGNRRHSLFLPPAGLRALGTSQRTNLCPSLEIARILTLLWRGSAFSITHPLEGADDKPSGTHSLLSHFPKPSVLAGDFENLRPLNDLKQQCGGPLAESRASWQFMPQMTITPPSSEREASRISTSARERERPQLRALRKVSRVGTQRTVLARQPSPRIDRT
jgi:hypothetical protein